ncbi:MAG: ABC transporter permease [Prolixibacteraceae bacterium]|nr:ABC transporter permease [Prolixibacteraceae bacterium]MDI9565001.1 ABC transporter permease [Bacteroidota bacterium]NLT00308.1 FtsX-like permease family protein [Bacteroidales bacterium]OQB81047.1 MAG: Macrolide export ATP-binding/permease protein MacB [Bacteroidetes bacterium ADurb.Bin123]HNZ69195.1 ABC transporter permease [Prolixibacteraceae bacterium]
MKRMFQRYLHDILIGIEAIQTNKIKSLLTALGIIFGVAAVISMLAIGNGAEHEILEQIKMVGVNNIIISPSGTVVAGEESQNQASGEENGVSKKKFSKGLTLLDAEAIEEVLPTVARVCPLISINYSAILNGRSKPVTLEGTNNHYFDLFNISLQDGTVFNERQQEKGYPVCIIGDNIKNLFFGQEDPIGKYIKTGEIWLRVIGVVERRDFTASASDEMGISSTDNKIFIPVKTMLLRFRNRSLVRADEIERMSYQSGSATGENLNQLDKIIVQVKETEQLTVTSEILSRLLLRRHNDLYDFEITIPELLLKQQQRTKNIFNIVLGVIAGISLIVGGIGIMNIMLSSVMERIREIGLRQAIGASRNDIIVQFLAESTLISVVGGFAGIILGITLSKIITAFFEIKTIVSLFSIVIAFGVSALVGITFGYLPAKRASDQDPVESLRQ